jgi:hypothetical protein
LGPPYASVNNSAKRLLSLQLGSHS